MYLFTQFSAWTLVIVTCERVVSILRPHDIRSVCTKIKSGFFIIAAVMVVGSTNIPIFFVLGKSLHVRRPHQLTNVSNTTLVYRTCVVKPDSGTSTAIFFTFQFLKQCLLPFVIILILNIIIIVSLLRRCFALLTSLQEVTCETLDEAPEVRTKTGLKKIVSQRDASLSVI